MGRSNEELECGGPVQGTGTTVFVVLTGSVEAVLEQFETELVATHFDAFELFDGNADAEALHGASFGSHYATGPMKVTCFASVRTGEPGQQKSRKHREELAPIEVVAVGGLKQNGGGDVQQNAHQYPIQCAEHHP